MVKNLPAMACTSLIIKGVFHSYYLMLVCPRDVTILLKTKTLTWLFFLPFTSLYAVCFSCVLAHVRDWTISGGLIEVTEGMFIKQTFGKKQRP